MSCPMIGLGTARIPTPPLSSRSPAWRSRPKQSLAVGSLRSNSCSSHGEASVHHRSTDVAAIPSQTLVFMVQSNTSSLQHTSSGVRWKNEQSAPRWQSPRAKCRQMNAVSRFCGRSARVNPTSVARQHRVFICVVMQRAYILLGRAPTACCRLHIRSQPTSAKTPQPAHIY